MSASPDRPPGPGLAARLPFFYGWLIAAVAMLSSSLGAGLNNVSMSPVFKPMTEDLGWSRTLTAGAVSLGSIGGGFTTFLFGRLVDRFGPRVLLPLGAGVVGTLALAISFVSQPWQLYAAYAPARALGQALLSGVVPQSAAASWFYRKRPRVMGLVAMATPLGSAVLVLVYQALIISYSWRAAFVTLGLLLLGVLLVPAALILRRRPEDLGLLPDGAPLPNSRPAGPAERQAASHAELEYNWTAQEALRTPSLWLTCAAATLGALATGSLGFHLSAYLTDVRIDPVLAAGAVSTFATTAALGSVGFGFLLERLSVRRVFSSLLLASAGGVLLLMQVQAAPLAFVCAALLGATARTQDVMTSILLSTYFGRRSYGSIAGIVGLFLYGGLGLGPFVGAWLFDATGGYEVFFQILIVAYLLASTCVFLARRPAPPGVPRAG